MTGHCESCKRRSDCNKTIGIMYGYCNTDYEPVAELVYTIRQFYDRFAVCEARAGYRYPMYLVSTRMGKDEWRGDLSWARPYAYRTAKKHVMRLISTNPNAAAVINGEIVKGR